jgi:hypothetical protein
MYYGIGFSTAEMLNWMWVDVGTKESEMHCLLVRFGCQGYTHGLKIIEAGMHRGPGAVTGRPWGLM